MKIIIKISFCIMIAAWTGCASGTPSAGEKESGVNRGQIDPSSRILAVMPFANETKNKDVEWLGAGVADTVSSKLAAVKNIVVVERVQIANVMNEMQLGMTGLIDESTAPEAGKMLGAKILVIGSFASVKTGVKIILRFNCKVIDAKTGQLLGGGGVKSAGGLENIFNIEEEIAETVVNRVGLALSGDEKRYFKVPAASSVAAYELYSQALLEPNAQSKKRLLERALELDKKFARAHLALGYIIYEMSAISGENKELVDHCSSALKKDPRLIEANYIMASYYDRISKNEDDELIPDNAKKAIEHYGIYIEKAGNSPLPPVEKRVTRAEKRIKELKG